MQKNYITIHRDSKYGGWDFGVSALCEDIGEKEIQDFRATCMVAFRVADNMWMRKSEQKEQTNEQKP